MGQIINDKNVINMTDNYTIALHHSNKQMSTRKLITTNCKTSSKYNMVQNHAHND